jgi:hypothetical protein
MRSAACGYALHCVFRSLHFAISSHCSTSVRPLVSPLPGCCRRHSIALQRASGEARGGGHVVSRLASLASAIKMANGPPRCKICTCFRAREHSLSTLLWTRVRCPSPAGAAGRSVAHVCVESNSNSLPLKSKRGLKVRSSRRERAEAKAGRHNRGIGCAYEGCICRCSGGRSTTVV